MLDQLQSATDSQSFVFCTPWLLLFSVYCILYDMITDLIMSACERSESAQDSGE